MAITLQGKQPQTHTYWIQVTEEKYLVVIVDNELKFHKHTATTIKRGQRYTWVNKEIIC